MTSSPAAMPRSAAIASTVDDFDEFSVDPPSDEEIAFDQNVGMICSELCGIPDRHERLEIAWALNLVFDRVENTRWRNRRDIVLSARQRGELLEAVARARLGVEIYFSGEERDDVVNALRAFQALAVHFGKTANRRTLSPDRFADLIA